MMMLSLVTGGITALLQSLSGYMAAHLYLYLDELYPTGTGGQRLVFTPQWLLRLIPQQLTGRLGRFATDGSTKTTARDNASTSGRPTGSFWSASTFQGKGHRLGT